MNTKNLSVNTDTTLAEIQIFENSEFGKVRTAEIDGVIHFCGSDVAKALGYSNANKAVNDHCRCITKWNTPHPQSKNKTIEMSYISEGDVYRLIASSKLPSAQKFESWVFDEVLPSIRKSGSYQVISVDPLKDKEIGLERARLLREIAAEYNGNSKTWKQILDAHATKELTGEFLLPLPEVTEQGKTAEMIGKPYGLSCQKVGAIIKKLGITKTDVNGFVRVNKAKNCNREVETFYYNEEAERKIVEAIEKELGE